MFREKTRKVWEKKYGQIEPSHDTIQNSEIPVEIKGKPCKALLDTGATVNVVSPRVLQRYPYLKKNVRVASKVSQSATTACSNKPVELKYEVPIQMTVLTRLFTITFFIVEDLQSDMILGTPFMRQAEVCVGYDKNSMYVTFNSTIRLGEKVQIPPMSERIVTGQIKGQFHSLQNVLVCGDTLNRFTKSVLPGRTLVKAEVKQKTFPVLLSNVSETTVHMPKNLIIGHVLAIDEDDIMEMPKESKQFSRGHCLGQFETAEGQEVKVSERRVQTKHNTGKNSHKNKHKTKHLTQNTDSPETIITTGDNDMSSTADTYRQYKQNKKWYKNSVPVFSGKTEFPPIQHELKGCILDSKNKQHLTQLLGEYDDVFYHEGEPLPACTSYQHRMHIRPDTKPWKPIQYRYNPVQQEKLDEKIAEMYEAGIIEPSESEYLSPVILVKRKGSSNPRFVLDLRVSNACVTKDHLTPISLHDVINALPKSPKYITSLDMKQSFYQIEVVPEDRKFVAFRSRDEIWQLKRCPMGHKNSAQSLCRMLTKVLKGLLWRNVYSYINDILILTDTQEEHLQNLEQVFQRFREHKLKLNAQKSEFCVSEIPFLGYKISEKGLSIDPEKLTALDKYKQPTSKKELKQYLGFVNFLKRSVPSFSLIARPLYRLLRKEVKFEWSDKCEQAYTQLNEAIKSAKAVQLPDYKKDFVIETDSSNQGTGAVLLQMDDQNKLQPIHFASFRFNEREQRQSITFQELLGCVMALKYFHKYIAYNKVILRTDHRPIVHLFKNAYSDSQTSRMMTVFERYDLEIQFKPGKKNAVADYLSRAQTMKFSELNLQKLEEYVDSMSFPTETKQKPIDKKPNINKLQLPHIIHSTQIDTGYWQTDNPEFTVNTETEENEFFQTHKPIPQAEKNIYKLARESSLTEAEESRQKLQTESEGAIEGKNPSTATKQTQLQRTYADNWVNDTQTPKALLMQHQKQDTYFEPIYKFLTTGILPENPQKARFILIEAEFYEIRQGLLYRVSVTQYAKNNTRLQYCIALPKQYVDTILQLHHKAGHYSTLKMFHMLRDKYYFPKMRKSIDMYVSQCPECQQYKNPRHADRQYIIPTELPEMMSTWSIDLKGPITAQGTNYRYILVAVEHVSRYMELCPLVDCTTNTVMQAFYDNVILRHGKAKVLQLDKASYFTSETMKTVAKMLGCELQY